ncbi:MAG: 1-(5-phosphoribosyl)-5-[(5-phosphoribosylamino)methylideneamino]imidazole-4-carboxamide isomerase [Planctomycetota bacterium]|nr:1-(5-phosphoribosyl)-5-[(5-phosphoribosylamino)methylideneamino]imidazole-4-carboxamide isomerase [Planctomycetota bacterium]
MSLVILPSVDLRAGRVVRLKQGDYARQLNYDVDPIQTARSFADAGAEWMHIVDLDGAKDGRPAQTDLISCMIAASGLNVQVGGGIRETQHIQTLLAAGAARVVVGTKALEDWTWFENLAHDPAFAYKLVLALDAKDGVVATRGWTQSSGKLAVHLARQVTDWPLAAILYTDVAKDGMMSGPNIEQTRKLAVAGKVPVIASGGVGSIDHIRKLTQIPAWGVIVGRSLYEGAVDLRQALAAGAGPV